MPFINEILKHSSLSIVGLEKNTGKTECLNYVLKRLPVESRRICVTSIGIDGERVDQVTQTAKPEIALRKGMYFATSEKHYKIRKVLSELVDVSDEETSLGRVVTAKALEDGKVLISGPSSTPSLKRWMNSLSNFGIELSIVDGAISRMCTASPAISDTMILSTGAAYSANLSTLIRKTAFVVEMIGLPVSTAIVGDDSLQEVSSIVSEGFSLKEGCKTLLVSGALTDRFLKKISSDRRVEGLDVVVGDFTKIFVDIDTYRSFIKKGGRLCVMNSSTLVAVCVNPVAPNGFVLDSDRLCSELSDTIGLPVYDIVKNTYSC